VGADLEERAGIEEQLQPLSDRELAGRVLSVYRFRAPHRPHPGATCRELVDEILEAHLQASS
jgi:hypothetical protein